MAHGLEVLLQERQKLILRSAPQDLGEKGSAGRQYFHRKLRCHLAQMHDAQVVRLLVASGGGGHIGKDNVRLPGQKLLHLVVGAFNRSLQHHGHGEHHECAC